MSLYKAHFLTTLDPANEYLHHTREQIVCLETNQCGGRSLRTILIGFAQGSMEVNGYFTSDAGRESPNFTLEIRTVIQWQLYGPDCSIEETLNHVISIWTTARAY